MVKVNDKQLARLQWRIPQAIRPTAFSIACCTFPTPLLACWRVRFSFIRVSFATADAFAFTIGAGQQVKIVDGH
jgi:hypothetical protein